MQYTHLGRTGLQVSRLAARPRRRTRGSSSECYMSLQTISWPADKLRTTAETDDLHISPFREDGVTDGTPTWTWSVVVDGALYVRRCNGQPSRWYQAATRQEAGRIRAAGRTKDVVCEPVDGSPNDRVDHAYRAKYAGSPYVKPMIGARGQSATARVVPRG